MTMQAASKSNESPSHNKSFNRVLGKTFESREVDDETSVKSMGLLFIWVSEGMIT